MIETTDGFPVSRASSIPTVTSGQMAEVDGLAVEEFGIDIVQMMEQAGSHLAELARAELGGDLRGRRIVVAVGPGNNGGGGACGGPPPGQSRCLGPGRPGSPGQPHE